MDTAMIESVRIRGFRSLADVEISGLPRAAVLIGANGSGKSNFIRFFEMLSWMIKSRKLGDFIAFHGGADDQLFGGNRVTPRLDATITMRTDRGRNDYRFALSHAHPDRFFFSDERFRFNSDTHPTAAEWQPLGSGHREAMIVEMAQTGRRGVLADGAAPGKRIQRVSRCQHNYRPCDRRPYSAIAPSFIFTTHRTSPESRRDGMLRITIIFAVTAATWRPCYDGWNERTYAGTR